MDIQCRFTTINDTPTPDQNIKYGMNNALGGLRFLILVKIYSLSSSDDKVN